MRPRAGRQTQLALGNRRQGPAEVQSIVEQRAPNGFDDIASVVSAHELAEISAQYKRLAGFDQDSVNATEPSSCS